MAKKPKPQDWTTTNTPLYAVVARTGMARSVAEAAIAKLNPGQQKALLDMTGDQIREALAEPEPKEPDVPLLPAKPAASDAADPV